MTQRTAKRSSRRYRRTRTALIALATSALCLLETTPASSQPIDARYLYTLSSFTGPIRLDYSRVAVDRAGNEVYALYQGTVRVFNDAGMEVYRFGDDLALGRIVDMAIDGHGDILLLAYRNTTPIIVRCNYRGEPRAEITVRGLPDELRGFGPNRLATENGTIYLASTSALVVVAIEPDGKVKKTYDLMRLLDLDEADRGTAELGGFGVDRDGNLLLTIPVMFRAYVVAADDVVTAFGKAGSAPGRFNITGGIARDSLGNTLVVDRLKSAVLVFDRGLKFVTQFATRGSKPGQLIAPDDLAVDGHDRVYVTQSGKRGISVFGLMHRQRQRTPMTGRLPVQLERPDQGRTPDKEAESGRTHGNAGHLTRLPDVRE